MMACDGKTMFVQFAHPHDIAEHWLAMTLSTRTAHNEICDKLDRIGKLSNHDGKTLTVSLEEWGDDPMDDVFAWLAMTAATKKAWEEAWGRMHPDGYWT